MRSTTILTGARVYAEASLGAVERERVARAVTRGVAQAAADLGLPFARPPEVYVFTTRGSFSLGLRRGFGQRAADANALAYAKGGVAFARESAVVINWQAIDPALAVVAHELTHLLVHEAAGLETPIPAWFDEGLATQEQRTADTDDLASAKDASTTLAILRADDVSLTSFTTPGDWTLVDARLGGARTPSRRRRWGWCAPAWGLPVSGPSSNDRGRSASPRPSANRWESRRRISQTTSPAAMSRRTARGSRRPRQTAVSSGARPASFQTARST